MAAKSNLRREIQALRNQAKARGHVDFSGDEDIREKAFIPAHTTIGTHAYVRKDLVSTGIFLLIALAILLLASIEFSSFSQLNSLRSALHLAKISF